ncbi:MAG: hypothetical protein RJB18_1211 [Pseudomonadota bacterium]|jgi:hypothetical protein
MLRKPPAYQEYAATTLSTREFKFMTMEERGLLYTIKLDCWLNNSIPSNHEELAKYFGVPVEQINSAFTDNVKSFLKHVGNSYECIDIEIYRNQLNARLEKQSKGGKKGAKITNDKRSMSAPNSQPPRQDANESLIKTNQFKTNQNQSVENDITNSWIQDYERIQ